MWQRFSERARRAIFHGYETAEAAKQHVVDTEHILVGILMEPDGVSQQILDSCGVEQSVF